MPFQDAYERSDERSKRDGEECGDWVEGGAGISALMARRCLGKRGCNEDCNNKGCRNVS